MYTDEQRSAAEEILRFLMEEKQLTVHHQENNSVTLCPSGQIDQDCTIILVSNAAVEDQAWQALVAKIPEDVRMIPVNCALNADSIDPEHIPAKIKEINYIYMDGNHLANIWDSLITEKEFYTVKSMLLLNKSAWLFSKCSDDFLLSDRKKIKQYLLLFQNCQRRFKIVGKRQRNFVVFRREGNRNQALPYYTRPEPVHLSPPASCTESQP